jgi:hypothetical protein
MEKMLSTMQVSFTLIVVLFSIFSRPLLPLKLKDQMEKMLSTMQVRVCFLIYFTLLLILYY